MGNSDCLNQRDEALKGIIPRAIHQILAAVGTSRMLKVSFQEVYLDSVRDLLNSANVLKNANLGSKYEATQVDVNHAERVFQLFKRADENRKVASTACNANSSRSHLIF